MPTVISDASPLIGLDRAGYLDVLPRVFGAILAPPAVITEFGRRPAWLADVGPLRAAQVGLLRDLRFGPGEAEALAAAMERPGSTLLLDEKRARAFATARGLHVVGTLGVVLRARQRGLVPAAKPVLGALARNGFRISEALYRSVLERAGEQG